MECEVAVHQGGAFGWRDILLGRHEAVSCPECAGGLFYFFISVLLSTRGQISLIEFSKLPFGDYSAMLLRIILPLQTAL